MTDSTPKFATERTQRFRATELSEDDARTIRQIEEFGCSIIHVAGDSAAPGWSYTVGVYDTCGKPELIVIGLESSLAHVTINNAVYELRKGTNLAEGRHREMVGNVECEFRTVDPKWIKPLMGYDLWYYGAPDFPVLQVVYPDLDNRFPGEPDFNTYFEQPLLQSDAEETRLEQDLLAANDKTSSLFNWKFPDPPHTTVFLSQAVHKGIEAITYVSHDRSDGAWQFLGESMSDDLDPVISCFHHPIDGDPSLKELADLPLGWFAKRTKLGEPWVRHELQHEEDEPAAR